MPSLVTGLGGPAGFGEGVLGRNDDSSTGAINITSVFGAGGLNFFGTNHTSLFVNNNGNITFGNPLGQYIGAPIGAGGLNVPIIAAYWFDIDTRGGVDNPSPGGTSTGSNLVYYDLDTTNRIFTATWDDVGYFSGQIGNPNAFQIRLIDVGGGDFDIEFIYEHINQSTSATNDSFGETPRAGYARGNGSAGFELTLSDIAGDTGDFEIIKTIDTEIGNTGQAGYYYFQVRGGVVSGGAGGGPSSSEPPPPPRPATFDVRQIGLFREGDEGTVAVDVVITRSGDDLNAGSVVDWEITLDDPNDLAPGQPFSGFVAFAPFETTATVRVEIQGDRRFEDDEWFHFRLTQANFNGETWDPGVDAVGVIVNDDPAVNFQFAGPVTRAEGLVGASPFDFVVLRSGDLSRASTVTWTVSLDTADAQDLDGGQALSGTIEFAAGQDRAIITVNALGDVRPEPDETFTVRLVSATTGATTLPLNASAAGVILDDDSRQSLLIASPSALVLPEGDAGSATSFNITIMRVGDVATAASAPYAISFPTSGGLSPSEMQSALTGTISFAAGASQATLTVVVTGDVAPEGNESFVVTLGGGALNTLSITGVVLNDDKVATAGAGPFEAAAAPIELSTFMSQLMGGGLWSDAGAV
ncbi:MAG: hypothetical protein JNK30_07910 [Phenylobacterium sp.]|uniref:nidogen-like domain-containing protein n=1 Tax=Phenylobacterium sp. TaxID=1871053 RepID=UPI001A53320A|nr:nidogen-like domain-containing protein [Phenylobacterium sp.]MBL8771294.1 hypothetical protein [Phenylobacterium sp.]